MELFAGSGGGVDQSCGLSTSTAASLPAIQTACLLARDCVNVSSAANAEQQTRIENVEIKGQGKRSQRQEMEPVHPLTSETEEQKQERSREKKCRNRNENEEITL